VTADDQVYAGALIGCDLRTYTGLTLWARAAPGTDPHIRVKLPMLAELKISDGGLCDEAVVGLDKCSDSHGQIVRLPSDGSWRLIRLSFTDPSFKQEGWGAVFPWNPADVTGIQIQSQGDEKDQPFEKLTIAGADAQVYDLPGNEKHVRVAMVPAGDQVWFFRLAGPKDAVAQQRASFDAFLQTVQFK